LIQQENEIKGVIYLARNYLCFRNSQDTPLLSLSLKDIVNIQKASIGKSLGNFLKSIK